MADRCAGSCSAGVSSYGTHGLHRLLGRRASGMGYPHRCGARLAYHPRQTLHDFDPSWHRWLQSSPQPGKQLNAPTGVIVAQIIDAQGAVYGSGPATRQAYKP